MFAEGERRFAELMMEEKVLLSPFSSGVGSIARLREQQDGIRPVVVEANHTLLERQELESWMCRDRGKQCSEKVAIDHVVGRGATATPFVGGRRCSFV